MDAPVISLEMVVERLDKIEAALVLLSASEP